MVDSIKTAKHSARLVNFLKNHQLLVTFPWSKLTLTMRFDLSNRNIASKQTVLFYQIKTEHES